MCDGNVGVNSNECGECKKWTHFSCHVYYKGRDWKGDYRCPRCVHNLTGVLKKKVQIKKLEKRRKMYGLLNKKQIQMQMQMRKVVRTGEMQRED